MTKYFSMKNTILYLSIALISSCSTTGMNESYTNYLNDFSNFVEIEKDDFYDTEKINLKLLNLGDTEFTDPQEELKFSQWSGANTGCKFKGGGIIGTTLRLQYRLSEKSKWVYLYTHATSYPPGIGDIYRIKIGQNEPIPINSYSDFWTKEYPEILFGTEQPWYISKPDFESKHLQILNQLASQESLGLDFVSFTIRREGLNSDGNKRYTDSECRVVNNGRYTYMLDLYEKNFNN